ncbi:MAG TPA: DUF2809 domain-containing protein [Gemmatimonadaceae bacterium]|nr:DUF2809 domain-containing protein [Gemmatimonadaceae bacterium]
MPDDSSRGRLRYAGLALLTVAAGLLLVRVRGRLPPAAADVLGDALWAAMMYWWAGAAVPNASPRARALAALGVAWAVEASQLLHPPWLDAVRATRLGHLVLGADFDARDLLAYAGGVALAAACELGARRRTSER